MAPPLRLNKIYTVTLLIAILGSSLISRAEGSPSDPFVIGQPDLPLQNHSQITCESPQFFVNQAKNSEKLRQLVLSSFKKPLKQLVELKQNKLFELLQVLEKSGLQVSKGSFKQLRSELETLKVRTLPPEVVIFGVGNGQLRTEAIHLPGCIVMSESLLNSGSPATNITSEHLTNQEILEYSRSALLLHEALGARGYEDHDFQFSSLALAYRLDPQSRLRSPISLLPLVRAENLTPKSMQLADGGATVVGGGGDLELLSIKAILIKQLGDSKLESRGIVRIPEDSKAQFLKFILSTSIDHRTDLGELMTMESAGELTQGILKSALKVLHLEMTEKPHIYLWKPMAETIIHLFSYLQAYPADLKQPFAEGNTEQSLKMLKQIEQSMNLPNDHTFSEADVQDGIFAVGSILILDREPLKELIAKSSLPFNALAIMNDLILSDLYSDYTLWKQQQPKGRHP